MTAPHMFLLCRGVKAGYGMGIMPYINFFFKSDIVREPREAKALYTHLRTVNHLKIKKGNVTMPNYLSFSVNGRFLETCNFGTVIYICQAIGILGQR